jgi:membrane fusion protein (multidrug efflux system)
MGAGAGTQTAVPVEVTIVARRTISSYIETNGTLEAENEVDIVARVSGPVVQLEAEETMRVSKGQLLARIDPSEIESQLEISRVALEETRLAFERAERLREEELVSLEAFEDARAAYDSAQAQFQGNEIQLGYTSIRAPFSGLIIERYVKSAQHVGVGEPLFRISDFDPLLCPIQVPERNLPSLSKGQGAHLKVEAWPDERFEVRVTLQVAAKGRLRPGMFASVFLETETHSDAIVIPRAALALESIGDTVYVAGDGVASRREVELGFREGDWVEILSGVAAGERIVTVGQDALAEGTAIQVLDAGGAPAGMMSRGDQEGPPGVAGSPDTPTPAPQAGPPGGRPGGGPGGGQRLDISSMSPEQLEAMKERMRSFGMTDKQIEERLKRLRESQKSGPGNGASSN